LAGEQVKHNLPMSCSVKGDGKKEEKAKLQKGDGVGKHSIAF
jgi:hypothetical protein